MDFSSSLDIHGNTEYETSLMINQPDAPPSEVPSYIVLGMMMLIMILFFLRLLNIKKKRLVKEHSLYCTLERNLREQANQLEDSKIKKLAHKEAQLELKNFTSMKLDMSTSRAYQALKRKDFVRQAVV